MHTPVPIPYLPSTEWYRTYVRFRLGLGPTPELGSRPNRTVIQTPHGPLTLTVPILGGRHRLLDTPYPELALSEHGDWRHTHWEAICSAYGSLPLFHYVEPDFAPIYTSDPIPTLQALCTALHTTFMRVSHLDQTLAYLTAHPDKIATLPRLPFHSENALTLLSNHGPSLIFALIP